jgi:large subunit ribosomal protein L17
MRHRKAGKKLGRNSSHRRAILRNLATSFFQHEEISTTYAKAKVLRPIAEKMISLAKRGDLHARRQVLSYIMDKSVTHKLFGQMKDRFLDRQGGYTRILKTGHRTGDGAPLAIIQLLPANEGKNSGGTARRGARGEKKIAKKVSSKKVPSKGKMEVSEDEQKKVKKQ